MPLIDVSEWAAPGSSYSLPRANTNRAFAGAEIVSVFHKVHLGP